MAVVRSLFGRFSEHASRNKDAQRDHKSQGNLVCLGDNDRVAEAPKFTAPQFSRAPQFTGDMLGSFHNDNDHDTSAAEPSQSSAPQFTDNTLETLHNDPSIPAEKFSFADTSVTSEKFSFDDPSVTTEKFSLGPTSLPAEKFSFGQDFGKDLGENFSENLDQDFGDAVEQTLGHLMTQAREHRGVSREQVAAETRIPAYYVRMIESDSYDAIPDQLYLLPFFRRYAIFLGLDEHKIVARFIRDFEKSENEIVDIKTTKTTNTAKTIKTTKEPPHLKAQDSKAPEVKVWRQIAIAVLIVGALQTFLPRGIAMMRSTLHRTADSSSPVAISENTLPPSTIQPEDAPRLSNDAARLSNDAAPVLSDAPHPSHDAPQISNLAPQPVAAIQPADTSAAAAPSTAITTESAPQAKHHHRHHAHDATLLSNDAHPASDTPSLVPSVANDAPHPSSDAPQVSNAAPQPLADMKPAETPAAAALSPAITTASIAPQAKHHHHHAHTPPQSNDATAPSDDALRPTYEELHPVSDAPNASSDTAPSPNDAWHISNDTSHTGDGSHLSHPSNDAASQPVTAAQSAETSAAAPSPSITTTSAAPHAKHHHRHKHSRKLTHNAKLSSKPTT